LGPVFRKPRKLFGPVKRILVHLYIMHLSMLSPREGTLGICRAFDFSGEFLVKIPTMGPQNLVKPDQISPPCIGELEVISLTFIVVVVYVFYKSLDINCQSFLFIPLMLCVIRGK